MRENLAQDRRNQPRRQTALRVEALDNGTWMMAQDLSMGGMLVTTQEPRWPGSFVPVQFSPKRGAKPIEVLCQVMNLVEVPCGVGLALRFVRFSRAGRSYLHHFLLNTTHLT